MKKEICTNCKVGILFDNNTCGSCSNYLCSDCSLENNQVIFNVYFYKKKIINSIVDLI